MTTENTARKFCMQNELKAEFYCSTKAHPWSVSCLDNLRCIIVILSFCI